MKTQITGVKHVKSFETKFGEMQLFEVSYDNKKAFYTSKSKEQKNFIQGQEAEFIEEVKEGKNGEYLTIKPIRVGKFNDYSKSVKKEQARYSAFAYSYCKDLIIAGKLDISQWQTAAHKAALGMVEIDKEIERNADNSQV